MKKTRNVDVMLSQPGIWVAVVVGGVFFVEVDAFGRAWQLNLNDFKRDGELRAGGWEQGLAGVLSFVGPLQRTPHPPELHFDSRLQFLVSSKKTDEENKK